MSAPRIILLSNGHGEDAIGVLIAEELLRQRPDLQMQAYPTVDRGTAYERLDIPILGPRQLMPSGGFLLHSLPYFLSDLRAGFLPMTLKQLRDLRRLDTDILLVVGDVYALLLSQFINTKERYYMQPLVSVYHQQELNKRPWNRYFMERFSGLERRFINRSVRQTYVRDAPTVAYLQELGIVGAKALGNPMLDALTAKDGDIAQALPKQPKIALLPGTRRYAVDSLTLMLAALSHWPEATGLVAWAGGELVTSNFPGWQQQPPEAAIAGLKAIFRRQDQTVYLFERRFAEVLHSSDLALGTAGTANEQAAALGLPVVAFAVPPLYTTAFLQNQKQLLAEAVTIARAEPLAIATALRQLWTDKARYAEAALAGKERMGPSGGAAAIAADILRLSVF